MQFYENVDVMCVCFTTGCLTSVCLAPLTNIAHCLLRDDRFGSKLKEIIVSKYLAACDFMMIFVNNTGLDDASFTLRHGET